MGVMETPKNITSINDRIREGIARLAVVLRRDDWERAKCSGLNPTQLSILDLLEGNGAGLSVQAIARHLILSQPTVTDSVQALERKGLVDKQAGSDKRSVTIVINASGRAALAAGDDAEKSMLRALDLLAGEEQEAFLLTLVRVIRHLQAIDAIPVQRMCTTCRYFDPFVHPEPDRPHHCHYVNASFGQPDIRIDCREHETADPASQAATWDVFQKG